MQLSISRTARKRHQFEEEGVSNLRASFSKEPFRNPYPTPLAFLQILLRHNSLTGSTLFPKRLFASIRLEKPHVEASQRLIDAATQDSAGTCRLLRTSTSGLSEDEARSRLNQYGPNILATDAQGGFGRILRHAVFNPLVMLLASLVLVSFITGDIRAATVMSAMIVLGVGLNLLQEGRASKAAAKLKAMISLTATVVRNGQPKRFRSPNWCPETSCCWPLEIWFPPTCVCWSRKICS